MRIAQFLSLNGYPTGTKRHFLDALVAQLKKADINATDVLSRTYGKLGLLRHGIKSHNARFSLCQFKPEYNLKNIQIFICKALALASC